MNINTFNNFNNPNFFALLFNLNLANGMAIMASVATIKTHQMIKFVWSGSLIKSAMDPEKPMNNKDKTMLLPKIEINAVEYTRSLSSVLFEKLKKAVSIP